MMPRKPTVRPPMKVVKNWSGSKPTMKLSYNARKGSGGKGAGKYAGPKWKPLTFRRK